MLTVDNRNQSEMAEVYREEAAALRARLRQREAELEAAYATIGDILRQAGEREAVRLALVRHA